MTYHNTDLNALFHALSDPTRRAVLTTLASGPKNVGELAEPFQMALPSLMQHLRKLENCGLIETHKSGRVRHCALRPQAFAPGEDWMAEQRAIWAGRLDRLETYLESLTKDQHHG